VTSNDQKLIFEKPIVIAASSKSKGLSNLMIEEEIRFTASQHSGEVSAILARPDNARWLIVLAHGAGAGIRHGFMAGIARTLFRHGIASFRYQFPYMEQGKKAPNPQPILLKTVRSAIATAREYGGDLPLYHCWREANRWAAE
jgi:uncharacterized protein